MIEPALSAQEWTRFFRHKAREASGADSHGDGWRGMIHGVHLSRRFDAVSALALNGQPFGFTWEDVARLRGLADWYEDHTKESVVACPVEHLPGWQLRNIADRIEALLPPREPKT